MCCVNNLNIWTNCVWGIDPAVWGQPQNDWCYEQYGRGGDYLSPGFWFANWLTVSVHFELLPAG